MTKTLKTYDSRPDLDVLALLREQLKKQYGEDYQAYAPTFYARCYGHNTQVVMEGVIQPNSEESVLMAFGAIDPRFMTQDNYDAVSVYVHEYRQSLVEGGMVVVKIKGQALFAVVLSDITSAPKRRRRKA